MTKRKSSKKNSNFFLGIAIFLVAFFVLIFFIPVSENLDCFETIDDVVVYAQSMPELPAPDNKNLLKPDYTSFYKSNLPGLGSKVKAFLRLGTMPFSVSFFRNILKCETNARKQLGFKENFIHKMSVKKGQNIIIYGDVQGAFHSFTRDLVKLKDLKLINNDFTLVNPQDYIIFMGDFVSRSPYTMETLSLILRLMLANGGRVICLKGSHESGTYWQQHSLKIELDIRASHLADIKILTNEVDEFFYTLPLALYLQQGDQLVRISPWSADDEKHDYVKEDLYVDFLAKPAKELETFFVDKDAGMGQEVSLRVIIKAQKKREKFQIMDGLRFLFPERGATAWTLLACPTLSYQKLLKYFHDSFSVLKIEDVIDNWIITKYSRHVEKDKDFYSAQYNFVSGKELTAIRDAGELAPVDEKPEEEALLKDLVELEEGEAAWGFEEETVPAVTRKKVGVRKKSEIESKSLEKPEAEKMEVEKEGEEEMGFEQDVEDFVEE